ncbi:MAG: hypothetical protein AAB820_01515 [Patescibacteria group bacterium]
MDEPKKKEEKVEDFYKVLVIGIIVILGLLVVAVYSENPKPKPKPAVSSEQR